MAYTLTDKLACLERELRYRRRVYPRWILEGRMTTASAEHECSVLQAIIDDYRRLRDQESPRLDLRG